MIEDLTLEQYEAALREDFASFVARCFHDLNPQADLAMNWHLEVIAAKLIEVRRGTTSPAISCSTAALSGRGRVFRSLCRPATGDGPPARWRAEALFLDDFIRLPARRCGRRGPVPLWPRQSIGRRPICGLLGCSSIAPIHPSGSVAI